jgi:hypothetical protein
MGRVSPLTISSMGRVSPNLGDSPHCPPSYFLAGFCVLFIFLGQTNPVQHGPVLRDRYEGVGGNRARGRRRRYADPRKGKVTRQ